MAAAKKVTNAKKVTKKAVKSAAKKAPAKKSLAKKAVVKKTAKPAKQAASKTQNKTQVTSNSVAAFLARLPDAAQREDGKAVLAMMEKATGEAGAMWGSSIVGCGKYHYRYESGREGDTMIVGFAPRKTELVLYLGLGGDMGVSDLLAKLGKHKLGKGCLYIKRLADVDAAVLARVIEAAARRKRAHAVG